MKLLVDAVGVRPGSAAIVIGNTLLGWAATFPQDEIVVLTDGPAQFAVPVTATVESLVADQAGKRARLWAQSVGVRRACRALGADALLSAVSASSLLGAGCPAGTIVYDVRHELRPDQFPRSRRLVRRVLYGWSFRRADALFCISERTRSDLVRPRPRLARKAIATPLGADHAAGWRPGPEPRARYVLAFGHFANKNVGPVIRAWQFAAERHPELTLRICGLGRSARPVVERLVAELGLDTRVELLPWLSDAEFEATFAGASAVLFPSDFEGFGLPAVEAMLLGIPVVVSADPALLEVTAGHAAVAHDEAPATLASALDSALARTPEQLDAARRHAQSYTWARTATLIREALAGPPLGSRP